MSLKIRALTTSAMVSTLMWSFCSSVYAEDLADDQVSLSDVPAASTEFMPTPSVDEQIVYLRDAMALATLRLDEAEQLMEKQSQLLELQSTRIAQLEKQLVATQSTAQAASNALVSLRNDQAVSITPFQNDGVYKVRSGDTLTKIAEKYNTNVQTLARANNITNPYRLSIGQQLAVPTANSENRRSAPLLAANTPSPSTSQPKPQPQQDVAPKKASTNNTPAPDAPQENGTEKVAIAERRRSDNNAATNVPLEVGQRRDEDLDKPYIALFSDVGGILTPRGTLYAEQGISYTTTSDNRFFFQGTEILDAILIGVIEATDSDRQAITGQIGARYGITNRLEVDARASYVYRDDRISGVAVNDGSEFLREIDGAGLGDFEVGLHYQLNKGKKFPYTIFNLRGKAPTGRGPFDIERNENGNELELATGSGFWTVEPSFTFIIPSAPASIFANIGYQANLGINPNQSIGINEVVEEVGNVLNPDTGQLEPIFETSTFESTLVSFDPGDALRTSLGVGLSVNDRLSLNFGYDQSYFFDTRSTIQTVEISDPTIAPVIQDTTRNSVTSGSFTFGGSYAINDRMRLNLNTAFGATDEAPDMRIGLRLQIKMFGE